MKVIRDRAIVDDDWVRIGDADAIPAAGRVLVSWARWQADKASLKARGAIGVELPPATDATELAGDLAALGLVALAFGFIQPKPEGGRTFDGRGYSQARALRERLGFRGEIRACGDVFRDAMFYMHRCGVNAFELKAGADLQDALNAFGDFSFGYQAAADAQAPVFRRRHA